MQIWTFSKQKLQKVLQFLTPSKPWIFFRILANHPQLCLALSFTSILCLWIISAILHATGYGIFKMDFELFPATIRSSIVQRQGSTYRTWLFNFTEKYVNMWLHSKTDVGFENLYKIDLFYEVKESNILTNKHLFSIMEIEEDIMRVKDYHKYYEKPFSLITYLTNGGYFNKTQDITTAIMALFNQSTSEVVELRNHVFPSSFKINSRRKVFSCQLLRSTIFVGHRQMKMFSESKFPNYRQFRDNTLRPYLNGKSRGPTNEDELEFRYWGQDLYVQDLKEQAKSDAKYVIGSVIFIITILLLHTQSLAVTLAAIFCIVSSVVGANLIYHLIFDYRYLGQFHIVSLFIIFGIGVDDVFILFDVWRDSFDPCYPQPASLADRLSQIYHRSVLTIFTTSFTSAFAFFANTLCEVPVVNTFGLFSGLVIVCNFILVVTFFPCVLINILVFFKWIKSRQQTESSCFTTCLECLPTWVKSENMTNTETLKQVEDTERNIDVKKSRWMARFFGDYFFSVVKIKVVSIALLCVIPIISIISIWCATKLKPSHSAAIQLFASGNYYRADIFVKEMPLATPINVYLVWGLKLEDRSKCHMHDYKCQGVIEEDDQFDLNIWEAQTELLKFCELLKNNETAKKLQIKQENGKGLVRCFLQDMNQDMMYHRKPDVYQCKDKKVLDLTVPIGQVKADRLMYCRSDIFGNEDLLKKLELDEWFDRNIETVTLYWLKYQDRKYLPNNTQNFHYSRQMLAIKRNQKLKENIAIPGKLGVMAISVTLDADVSSYDFHSGSALIEDWEHFMQETTARFPIGLRGAFECMPMHTPRFGMSYWDWFEVQEALVKNIKSGILLGLFAVAFPVLLLSVQNIFLTVIGVFCLACVTATAMAMAQLQDWSIGMSESINICLITGISIDHLIHFIEGYRTSSAVTRKEKVRDMLSRMGGAVSSGAITTLGAISFLFASKIIFFQQFGAFMFTSVAGSYLYALLFLTPFLLLFGPEGNIGSFEPLHRLLLRIVKTIHSLKKSSSENEEEDKYRPKDSNKFKELEESTTEDFSDSPR